MSSPDAIDTLVIGAGVVGLACGRALARAGRETLVVEQHRRIGEETSSRNSGVIHSGIYYPTDSLKARLCVRGKQMIYEYCEEKRIAHSRCGKLLIAIEGQLPQLQRLHAQGIKNGVSGLEWLNAGEAMALEPEVQCAAAVFSSSTGIVDVHELMLALLGDLEADGGMLALDSVVSRMRPTSEGIEVDVVSDGEITPLLARRVVNAAGLSALALLHRIEGYPRAQVPIQHLAKGNYFSCSRKPFRHLVYPMPDEAGLGIHATLDLDGSVRFGPDVEWVDGLDYDVDPARSEAFYAAIRSYWPGLRDGELQPAYAGIRTKLVGPGQKAADFRIEGPGQHGVAGLVNLLGIESPGLTAVLAIAERVAELSE